MPTRRTSFALAAVVALLAAGCGGGESREDYEENVQAMRQVVDSAVSRVSDAQSQQQLVTRLDEAAIAVDGAAEQLEREGAPDEFEDETETLVSSLRQMSVDLAGTADQLRDPAFSDNVLPQTRGLQFESWTRANRVLRDLREQGIDVEPWA